MTRTEAEKIIDDIGMLDLEGVFDPMAPYAMGMVKLPEPWVRFSDGWDAFVFVNGEREAECGSCSLIPGPNDDTPGSYIATNAQEMCNHLARHRKEGHKIPEGIEHVIRSRWAADVRETP